MESLIILAIFLLIINLILYYPTNKKLESLIKDNIEPKFKTVEKLSIDLQNTAIKLKKREEAFLVQMEKNTKQREKEIKEFDIFFNKMKNDAMKLQKREKEFSEFLEQRMGGTQIHKIKNIIKGKHESFPFIVVTDS